MLNTMAYAHSHAHNAELLDSTPTPNINYSANVLAEYSLSKHTKVYGTADFAQSQRRKAADYPGGLAPSWPDCDGPSGSRSGESDKRPSRQASQNAQPVYVNMIIAYDAFEETKRTVRVVYDATPLRVIALI